VFQIPEGTRAVSINDLRDYYKRFNEPEPNKTEGHSDRDKEIIEDGWYIERRLNEGADLNQAWAELKAMKPWLYNQLDEPNEPEPNEPIELKFGGDNMTWSVPTWPEYIELEKDLVLRYDFPEPNNPLEIHIPYQKYVIGRGTKIYFKEDE